MIIIPMLLDDVGHQGVLPCVPQKTRGTLHLRLVTIIGSDMSPQVANLFRHVRTLQTMVTSRVAVVPQVFSVTFKPAVLKSKFRYWFSFIYLKYLTMILIFGKKRKNIP